MELSIEKYRNYDKFHNNVGFSADRGLSKLRDFTAPSPTLGF